MHNSGMNERTFAGVHQLSLRSIIIGAIGSLIITASSMYIALRMGALPWPTIFVAVLSMALLKMLGKTTQNEINITQTGMSAGAMVAGGLAFTIPGLWILGIWNGAEALEQHFWKVLAIAFSGMILGSILTWYLRPKFVEEDNLPYPIGAAAAETIITGDAGGKKSAVLFGTMGFSAVFTLLRDSLGWIPGALSSKWLYAKNIFAGIWLSPMAVGIGYMIGSLYTGVWFLGGVISYLLIIPLGVLLGIFSSVDAASAFKNTAGIGLMVGTGIGILISYIISAVKKGKEKGNSTTASGNKNIRNSGHSGKKINFLITIISTGIAFVLSVVSGLNVVPSILLIAGVFLASTMAATITGQTGINPMEIFGIIILLAVRLFVEVDATGAFFIAACVAVACGYAGDLLNDYKTGQVLGTNPVAQLISQVVGGIVGTVVASLSMFAIINQFGGVGPDKGLTAAQAFAVSQMVDGIGDPAVFAVAAAIGVLFYLLKVPSMTLGIGLYLPFEITTAVFLGGLIRLVTDRFYSKVSDSGNVAASGFLGGEGITGVTVAIIKMIIGG
ncbi:MAG TPA: peptide transporter [Clostridiaceae bacterium]|nr:peptide transporter [Clostridiaceae bacterium]